LSRGGVPAGGTRPPPLSTADVIPTRRRQGHLRRWAPGLPQVRHPPVDSNDHLSAVPNPFPERRIPVIQRRRLRAFVTLTALVGSSLTLGLVILARSAHASSDEGNEGTITHEFRGRLENGFAPITQPPPSLILSNSGSGKATVLGKVTDSFTVNIDFSHPIANNLFLVSKTGSLFA